MSSNFKKFAGFAITFVAVITALLSILFMYENYFANPWTRDGQVRAQIIQVTPRVSGPVVELPIVDNQFVRQGELLLRIDPRTYKAKVMEAQASLSQSKAAADESYAENERIQGIYKRDKAAVSKRKVTATENAMRAAFAAVEAAEADLVSAKLDLQFTELRAPLDGYITNLNIQIGSQAIADHPTLALVDISNFWINGFFKETQIRFIRPGDSAVIRLMSHPDSPIEGIVDSLGWGIAQQDGSTGVDLLPAINPSFDWIRLAQRVPVRIQLTHVPDDIKLRVGTTASVFINKSREPLRP
ncbi:MAG: HlyD family secretion protein [Chlamydiota bacterium]